MKIKTTDAIVQAVIKKMDNRSLEGKKDLNDFLIDVQEEIMDALLYIEAARRCLKDEIEEAMITSSHGYPEYIEDEKEL